MTTTLERAVFEGIDQALADPHTYLVANIYDPKRKAAVLKFNDGEILAQSNGKGYRISDDLWIVSEKLCGREPAGCFKGDGLRYFPGDLEPLRNVDMHLTYDQDLRLTAEGMGSGEVRVGYSFSDRGSEHVLYTEARTFTDAIYGLNAVWGGQDLIRQVKLARNTEKFLLENGFKRK